MKQVATLIVLFCSFFCSAQHYQCLQAGVKHYFINGNGYLRGISIDSVITSGGDYAFYPYRTLRKKSPASSAPDTSMGSWLGGQVMMQPDGAFLFDNFWRDTVVIKSGAGIGESWTFYDDTTSQHYIATVTAVDSITVLGMSDSVKTITIHAYVSGTANPADPLNNFQIQLSKNNGFVKVFDLYTFPYRFTAGDDYFFTASNTPDRAAAVSFFSASHFSIVDFHNPTIMEIFNFNAGDAFEWQTEGQGTAGPPSGHIEDDYKGLQSDIILSKTVHSLYQVQYVIQRDIVENNELSPEPRGHKEINTIETVNCDTSYLIAGLVHKMPEELTSSLYYYNPADDNCISTPTYTIVNSTKQIYKQGLGLIYNEHLKYFGIGSGLEGHVSAVIRNRMIFCSTSGQKCGTYIRVPISVAEVANSNTLLLYPNPVTTQLSISGGTGIVKHVTITNLIGQVVYSQDYDSEKVEIDTESLSAGIYIARINESAIRRFIKH